MPDRKETQQLFQGKVAQELLNMAYNTPDSRMPELTKLSSREAFMLAGMATINRGRAYAADLAAYNQYTKHLAAWENHPALTVQYDEYIEVKGKLSEEEALELAEVMHPGVRPPKPKRVVKKPTPFFLSDDFNMRFMKTKRSVGGEALDALYKMGQSGIEVSVEEGDPLDPHDG